MSVSPWLVEAEWSNADIMLVTDGEIRPPNEEMVASLSSAKDTMGLKVHSLTPHPLRIPQQPPDDPQLPPSPLLPPYLPPTDPILPLF